MTPQYALVATPEGIVRNDGHTYPLVAGTFHDPRTLLELGAELFAREGTILTTVDFHGERATDLPLSGVDGWPGWELMTTNDVERTPAGTPVWSQWTRGRKTVHIGVLPHIRADRTPLFWAEEPAATIADRLSRYQTLTGVAWHGTAGIVGCQMLRERWSTPNKQPRWFAPHPSPRGAGDLLWSRELTAEEKAGGYVHAFDMNGQYLCAAGNAQMAWRGLDKATGPQLFDPNTAGFWLIDTNTLDRRMLHGSERGRPPLLNRHRADEQGRMWLSTPMMTALRDLGRRPTPLNAMTTRCTRPLLQSWAGTLALARDAATMARDARLLKAIKRTCNETVGLFERAGGRVHRPDWRAFVVDTARADLWRRIYAVHMVTGRWPVAVRTDCLWYAHHDADANRAAEDIGLQLGTRIGAWKVVGTTTASDYTPDVIRGEVLKRATASG